MDDSISLLCLTKCSMCDIIGLEWGLSCGLFGAEGFDWVFSRGGAGWNKTADDSENDREENEAQGVTNTEVGSQIFDTSETDEDGIDDWNGDESKNHRNQAR